MLLNFDFKTYCLRSIYLIYSNYIYIYIYTNIKYSSGLNFHDFYKNRKTKKKKCILILI